MTSPWTRGLIGIALITIAFWWAVTELPQIIADNLA